VKDLPEKGEDFLELYPRRAEGKVDRIDLVLIFPKRYNLRMSPAKGQSKGQLMTPKQLNDWRYYAPPGFAVAGWYGADMEGLGSHNSFRVDLQI
jgi:hypothetical protein